MVKSIIKKLTSSEIIKKLSGTAGVNFVGLFVGFISQTVLARYLGTHEYGIFVYAFSWVMLLSILGRFGFDNLIINRLPSYLKKKKYSEIKGLSYFSKLFSYLLSVVLGVLFFGTMYMLDLSNIVQSSYTFLIGFFFVLPLLIISYINQGFLVGLKQVVVANIPIMIIRHVLLIAFIILCYYVFGSVTSLEAMLLNGLAFLVVAEISFRWVKDNFQFPFKTIKNEFRIKNWLVNSFPFLLYSGASFINRKVDILILGGLVSATNVGIYNAAAKLVMIISVGSNITSLVSKPHISDFFAEGKISKIESYSCKVAWANFSYSLAAFSCIVLFGEYFLLIFGNEFKRGYDVLMIFAIGYLIVSTISISGLILIMTKYEKIGSNIELGITVFNILLNIVLIPKYGAIGAAFATSFTLILRSFVAFLFVRSKFDINPTVFNTQETRKLIKSLG